MIVVLLFIILYFVFRNSFPLSEGFRCNKKVKLLPIMEPEYNMREIVKNILLLEDHLFQKRKRCNDCIMKHFLIIEGLAEEMVTLDKKGTCIEYYDLAEKIRVLEKEYLGGTKLPKLAQELRKIRKTMMHKCFSKFQ